MQPARLWRPAIIQTRHVVVIQGSRYLSDWQAKGRSAVKRAARAGLLAATIVPITLHGPNNELPAR